MSAPTKPLAASRLSCVPDADPASVAPMAADLAPGELRAWRAFLRAHRQVTAELDGELGREEDLPLASYEVLLRLAQVPGREMRMSRLADVVLLSRSGLTRLVDRLEAEGLVERRACPTDARGQMAALTFEGLSRLRHAAPVHIRGVRTHFVGRLTAPELRQLADLLEKVVPPDA